MKYVKELTHEHGVRMTRKQKGRFRQYVLSTFEDARVDRHVLAKNVIIGDLESAEYVIAAHYDTPPRLPSWFMKHMLWWAAVVFPIIFYGLLELLFRIPLWLNMWGAGVDAYYIGVIACTYGWLAWWMMYTMGLLGNANKTNFNDNTSGVLTLCLMAGRARPGVAYVLFDNEEKGLIGSLAFRWRYRRIMRDKTIIILDCVGAGDELRLYTSGKTTPISRKMRGGDFGHLKIKQKKSNLLSMSDHVSFRGCDHVLMLTDNRTGPSVLKNIHCARDNYLDTNNITQLVTTLDTQIAMGVA